ncbi:MAG: hypothetical protein DMG61_21560 [Acidobacteria bacterium]|nr:MAG: hypothetical protein DMG61_21560 [Acidobacteriota bacterium]
MLLKRMASHGTLPEDLTGFVLAGGVSRRMGRDKAQIPWRGGTLLTHAIEQVEGVAPKVFVVGSLGANKLPVPVLADNFSGVGPLAGIQTALSNSSTDWNLVIAVDLPLVMSEVLKWIAGFRTRLQPLCAVYHRGLLPEIDEALARQQSSIHRLLERLSTRIIEEDELIANGFAPETFLNVNTPEDLECARAIAKTMYG